MRKDSKRLQPEDGRHLAGLLEAEHTAYRRLLRLAWRQNSYMRRQDVDRLGANALEWAVHLPAANGARLKRERFVGDMGRQLGVMVPPGRVGDLLDYADANMRREVQRILDAMRRTAGELARQNGLNRQLAGFCLDLAHEETEIFKRCVLNDPAGCYRGDASTSDRGPGGVLVRQA